MNTLIIQANQPTNTTQEAANQVVENLVVVLGRCYGVICALGSTCNKLNGMCECANPNFRGPACDIPITSEPELLAIRPKYLEFNRKPTDPQPVLMYVPHTAFIKYITPDDTVIAQATVDDGTGQLRQIITKNCTNIGNSQVSCPVSILITDEQLRNTIIIDWSYSVILAPQTSPNQKHQVVIPELGASRQTIYNNPCIQCSVNPIAKLGEQETCFRAANMCFPSVFNPKDTETEYTLNGTRSFFGQKCVGVGQSPIPDVNPCLMCQKDDIVVVNWASDECRPRLLSGQLDARIIETDTGIISGTFDISPYLKITSAYPENLDISPPVFRIQRGTITVSANINQNSVVIKLLGECRIMGTGVSTQQTKCYLGISANLTQQLTQDGYITSLVDVYSNYSLVPVDSLKIRVQIINNLDNDPTITTTTIKSSPTQQILTTQFPTSQQPSTETENIGTTTYRPQIVCPMLACQEGCYAERSTFTGCIIACLCQQTRATPDPNEPTPPMTTSEPDDDLSPIATKTLPPMVDNPRPTIKPVVVSSTASDSNKLSIGGLVGLITAAVLIIIIMLLAGYRFRYAPLNDIDPATLIQANKSLGDADPSQATLGQHNNPIYYRGEISTREFGMRTNPIYAATTQSVSNRQDDIFNNPTYSVHTNPLFVENNESLINPLYEALYTFEEGTYKFVGTSSNMRLFVKATGDVVVYDVAYDPASGHYSLSEASNPICFSSLIELSNHYADPATLDISPLANHLTRPLPSGTYNSGDLYMFNNANIKNIEVA